MDEYRKVTFFIKRNKSSFRFENRVYDLTGDEEDIVIQINDENPIFPQSPITPESLINNRHPIVSSKVYDKSPIISKPPVYNGNKSKRKKDSSDESESSNEEKITPRKKKEKRQHKSSKKPSGKESVAPSSLSQPPHGETKRNAGEGSQDDSPKLTPEKAMDDAKKTKLLSKIDRLFSTLKPLTEIESLLLNKELDLKSIILDTLTSKMLADHHTNNTLRKNLLALKIYVECREEVQIAEMTRQKRKVLKKYSSNVVTESTIHRFFCIGKIMDSFPVMLTAELNYANDGTNQAVALILDHLSKKTQVEESGVFWTKIKSINMSGIVSGNVQPAQHPVISNSDVQPHYEPALQNAYKTQKFIIPERNKQRFKPSFVSPIADPEKMTNACNQLRNKK